MNNATFSMEKCLIDLDGANRIVSVFAFNLIPDAITTNFSFWMFVYCRVLQVHQVSRVLLVPLVSL